VNFERCRLSVTGGDRSHRAGFFDSIRKPRALNPSIRPTRESNVDELRRATPTRSDQFSRNTLHD
jgi:hypothetical protein